MKSERVNPIRQHLQRAARYAIAAAAGVLFAYVAWAPQPPPGTEGPKAGPIELPAAMLDALREQGIMKPDETTIPPPVDEEQQAALRWRSDRKSLAFMQRRITNFDRLELMWAANAPDGATATNKLSVAVSAHPRAPPA